jgi:hypothetical protein
MVSDRSSVEATELRSVVFFLKKRVLGTQKPQFWVPSIKVHARFVLSKHVRKIFFHIDKTMESRKSDQSSGDYGIYRYLSFYSEAIIDALN